MAWNKEQQRQRETMEPSIGTKEGGNGTQDSEMAWKKGQGRQKEGMEERTI